TDGEKQLLGQIVEEGRNAFSTPLGDPYTEELIRREDPVFGCEELIGHTVAALCISLIRRTRRQGSVPAKEKGYPKRRMDEVRLREICSYLQDNVEQDLTSGDVLAAFSLSESSLQKLFQNKVGMGAMQYFQRLKIDRAKELIREKKLNFSEISERLGFSSIHYFSRRFKAVAGMTPSEYAASVKSISL
ncbi:MAG: helix-turn-helix transcriptional regulator, partial [Clostridia bacterium]|nr:helix-turn-helix transcriptional regulator [Clostridia bacterium]